MGVDVDDGFAALHRDVVFGRAGGRIIWQPRINCWITDKEFRNEELPMPFTNMSRPEIYRELRCSARIYEYGASFKQVEHPSIKHTELQLNETDTEITIQTPVGKLVEVLRKTPSSYMPKRLKWPVTTEGDLKVAIWMAERRTWFWDAERFEKTKAKWGNQGAPTMYMPRVNIQDLYINTMGVEGGTYALYDWKDTVESYFLSLDEADLRLIDVINESPVDIINFGDNVHAGTLSPILFEKYVLPAYQNRCEKLHKARKFVHAHWDGDVKPLLPFVQKTMLDGIEAITPHPQGDVSLEEVKESLKDNIFLIDGIPAIYFDSIFPLSTLIDCVRRIIEMFAPRLVLGISDEISSNGDIERVRVVGEIVEEFNSSIRPG